MKKVLLVLLAAAAGYVLGALAGYGAIELLSSNQHDRSVEAAMTGAFVTGPAGLVIAAIIAFIALRRRGRHL
jgi:hypothetical protein